jgi:hypothetical protein
MEVLWNSEEQKHQKRVDQCIQTQNLYHLLRDRLLFDPNSATRWQAHMYMVLVWSDVELVLKKWRVTERSGLGLKTEHNNVWYSL